MLKYNLCYITQKDKVLLLNRERSSWMGCWNGVGGKLEPRETPRASMQREILEETQIVRLKLQFRGLKTWSNAKGGDFGGLYLYWGQLPDDVYYPTPRKTEEGILDWKEVDWALHSDNLGVTHNLPSSLKKVLLSDGCYDHHSVFEGSRMVAEVCTAVNPRIEEDPVLLREYLQKYLKDCG